MRIFLDTSFIVAAAGSETGLPRFLFVHGRGWEFVTSLYCEEEVNRNIHKVDGAAYWLAELRPNLRIYATELVLASITGLYFADETIQKRSAHGTH